MRIQIQDITTWSQAVKTKPIKAKHLSAVIPDQSIKSKFLLDTIEGKEPMGENVVICIGGSFDAWQQTPEKLFGKYDVTGMTKDGWMDCVPKPDVEVDCMQVTRDFINVLCDNGVAEGWYGKFSIIGLWGATVGEETNVQSGVQGDYICRSQSDPNDIWIVHQSIFENTYTINQ